LQLRCFAFRGFTIELEADAPEISWLRLKHEARNIAATLAAYIRLKYRSVSFYTILSDGIAMPEKTYGRTIRPYTHKVKFPGMASSEA
jgi:hypothetical protein